MESVSCDRKYSILSQSFSSGGFYFHTTNALGDRSQSTAEDATILCYLSIAMHMGKTVLFFFLITVKAADRNDQDGHCSPSAVSHHSGVSCYVTDNITAFSVIWRKASEMQTFVPTPIHRRVHLL